METQGQDASLGALQPRGLAAGGEIIVRPGRDDDAARLAEMYNHYIVHTAITFDTEPQTAEHRAAWIAQHPATGRHRLFVAEREGLVLGFASSSRFNARAAYDTTVETSIVCAHDAVGLGLGARLYAALFDALRDEDVHLAVALITLPNAGSCALHERFGYERKMVLEEVGRKFGRWWAVAWYARRVGE